MYDNNTRAVGIAHFDFQVMFDKVLYKRLNSIINVHINR